MRIGKYEVHFDALWNKQKRQKLENRASALSAKAESQPHDEPEYEEELPVQPDSAERRPQRSAAMGCFMAVLYVVFILSMSALIAGFGWISACDMLGLMKEDRAEMVRVSPSDSIVEVTNTLKEAGIIDYPWLFKLFARFSKAEETIAPGSYEIKVGWDYRAIVRAMRAGSPNRELIRVAIPEGLTQQQILELLDEKGVAKLDELREVARNHKFSYDFIEDIPHRENRLEGFLFPDTYDFYVGENPVSALSKMLSNFNKKFTADMRRQAADRGYSIYEIVTIAAMIEREAVHDEERPTIASVIYNRLNNPSNYPFLEIDATIQYALPEHKPVLSNADKELDSPYNTYRRTGLPPGPICCPGIATIRAALRPESTDYYFYVLDAEGYHIFSKNYADHEKAIAKSKAN